MLTRAEEIMDDTAIKLSRITRETEEDFVIVLIKIEKSKLFRKFDHPHILSYIRERCQIESHHAYTLKRVVQVAAKYKELEAALKKKQINVAKASRLASSINEENQKELVEFAVAHTYDQADAYTLGMETATKFLDRLKPIAEGQWRWTVDLTLEKKEKLERIQAIEAQARRSPKRTDCLDAALEVYLDHRDKVRKAERAHNWKPREAKPDSVARRNLTAAQKHAVNYRDKGRCQYEDKTGNRCLSQSHVQSHHILYRSQGGTNEPHNLISVCWHHHDLIHQMEIPLEHHLQ